MKVQAVLFDLDGTLLDTLEDLTSSVNAAMRAFGLPVRTQDEVRQFVGNGVRQLMKRACPADFPNFEMAYRAFRRHYADHCAEQTAPYPGIMTMLETLRSRGIPCAVISNKMDPAVKVLAETFFPGLIASAVGESETVRRKPAPDAVLAAMAELGASPEGCVYVGDSDVDIETAKNAGIACISVSWGFRSREFLLAHGAAAIASDPQELLQLLR